MISLKTGRRKAGYRVSAVAAAAALCLALLAGCGLSVGDTSASGDTSSRMIYYLNSDRTLLSQAEYTPLSGQQIDGMSVQEQISDVLTQLSSDTGELGTTPPIRDFSVEETVLSGSSLTLNLSAEYLKLESTLEILTRAAIVNSLCQIDGVDTVSFLCGDEELTDADGDIVGAMTADMFIFSSGNEIGTYEKVRLHLYFASDTGDELVDTYRTVVYNSNISQERLVVEQVLKGPNSEVVYPTLNASTQILSVTTRDYVCYVNLDAAFLEEPYSVTSRVAIYSLVNSLTELTTVREVQILIDGDSTRTFMDTSLSQTFERDLSVVRGSSESSEE